MLEQSPPTKDEIAALAERILLGDLPKQTDFRLREGEALQTSTVSDEDFGRISSSDETGAIFVWDPEESPSLMRAAEEAGVDLDQVKGATLPDGTIIIVGKNHDSAKDLETTVAHEYGHERTSSYLGQEGYEKLAERTNPLQLMGIAKDLGIEAPVKEAFDRSKGDVFQQKRAALSEIFAKLNENIPFESLTEKVKRFVKEWLGAARQWMRDIGFAELPKLNDADLYYILSQAKKSGVETRALEGTEADFKSKAKMTEEEAERHDKYYASPPGLWQSIKANGLGTAFRTQFIDRFDPVMKIARQLYDNAKDATEKAAAIQMQYWARAADRVANLVAVSLSVGVPQITEVQNKDGTVNYKLSAKGTGLSKVLEDIGKAPPELFSDYVHAKRAKRVGYDVIYGKDTPEVRADALKAEALVEKYPSFAAAEESYIAYNKGLIDLLAAKIGRAHV
jgi:hypothetical protein